MSNDSESPPPLRLKPRLQPDSSQNPAATPTPEPLADTPPAFASPTSPAASEPSASAPDASTLDEPGRLKLKPRNTPSFAGVDPAAAPTPSSVPTPPPASPAPAAAPKPSLPAAALSAPPFARAPGRPPVPVTPLPPGGLAQPRPKQSISSQPVDEEGSGFKAGLWAFLAIGILALGLLAFLVIRFVAKREPKGETVVMKQSVPAAGTSAPSAESVTPEPHMDAVAQADAQVTPPPSSPRTLYGKAIVKAKNVVAVNDAHAADAAELLDDKQPPVVATPKAAPPSAAQVNASPSPTPAPMPAAAEVVVEEEKPVVVELPTPTPTPTPRPTPTPPPPSSAFRYFVVQMKVNGVFQGSDPRAVLNGRIFHEGEMVDPALGIMLLEIDTDAKKLIFREPSGAIMPRRY